MEAAAAAEEAALLEQEEIASLDQVIGHAKDVVHKSLLRRIHASSVAPQSQAVQAEAEVEVEVAKEAVEAAIGRKAAMIGKAVVEAEAGKTHQEAEADLGAIRIGATKSGELRCLCAKAQETAEQL